MNKYQKNNNNNNNTRSEVVAFTIYLNRQQSYLGQTAYFSLP